MVRKPRFWKSLPKEDKKGVVRTLLEAGYTREAIGKALGTTKNAVVGFQHSQLSDMTGKFSGTLEQIPASVLTELVSREWPINQVDVTMDEAQPEVSTEMERSSSLQAPYEQRTVSPLKPKYRIATDWRNQCTHKDKEGHQCAYEKESGLDRCKLHPL